MKISEDVKIAVTFVACVAYVGAFWCYASYNTDEVCPLGAQDLLGNWTDYYG